MGGSKKQTTTETKEPWAPAKPYLTDVMTQAKGLYDSGAGYHPWQGDFVAGLSGDSNAGMDMLRQTANAPRTFFDTTQSKMLDMMNTQGISSNMENAMAPLWATARGEMLSGPDSPNPYLTGLLNQSDEAIMSKVASLASGSGRYGSGAMGSTLGKAMGDSRNAILYQNYDAERQRQLAASGLLTQTYGQGLDRMGQAASFLPQIEQLRYDPAMRMMGLGSILDQRAQAELEGQISRWDAEQNAPWQRLSAYNSIVAPMGQQGGTIVQTAPAQKSGNPITGGLGGAMSGLALTGGNPLGAIFGGLLGAGSSFF
jgi:hypothetical protein